MSQMEKLGTLERVPYIFNNIYRIPPIYGLYNGCTGQHGVILAEQLLGISL